MAINLLTVRFVLQSLGEVDYGVFNAVAGVVLLMNSISVVLSSSTQRFFSVAKGRGDIDHLQKIFSVSINITILIGMLVLLLGETVGVWFINTYLNLPMERLYVANWVYQFSLFSFLCTMFQQPYIAASIAHEEMQYFSVVSTIECLLKLGAAVLLLFIPWDSLLGYGALLLLISIISLLLYVCIGYTHYEECHYTWIKDKLLHYSLLRYFGWTMFGSVAGVGIVQVITILTSVYFGPIVTASRAIALQIYNALIAFCSSFCMAIRPPMMEAIAANNRKKMRKLFYWSNVFIFVSMCAIVIPLLIWMPNILKLWLGNSNNDMIVFSRLMVIYTIILSMNNPITIWMHAIGRVKEYHLSVESVMLLCVPLTWLMYAKGLPAVSAYWGMIAVAVLAHVVRLICLKYYTQRHEC